MERVGFTFSILTCLILVKVSASKQDNCNGKWELIFHAPSGNGEDVLKAWTTKHTPKCDILSYASGDCQCTVTNGCLPLSARLEKMRSSTKILRSPLIDFWKCINVKTVRLELNSHGKTQAFVEFRGQGSTSLNWFHNSRISNTSWTDMHQKGSFNFFSISSETRYSRKFFINKNYGGCDSDAGWFVIEDVTGSKPCKWDKHKSYPQFLYSKNGRITRWNALQFGQADILNIYIERG
mmetsp:Transcript_9482/g.17879  ORF Transcript_9482/g.17879 Transcript_9482/m.17879 type:complete len:237 (-) Transcript_9482:112-822(-)